MSDPASFSILGCNHYVVGGGWLWGNKDEAADFWMLFSCGYYAQADTPEKCLEMSHGHTVDLESLK